MPWLWGLLLGVLAVAVARVGLPHVSPDNLYGYCFLRDLLTPGVRMAWSLPHSPYFFPDLLLVLPGVLFGGGIAATYHVAFLLHLGLAWGSIAFLSRTMAPRAPWARHADVATRGLALYLASVLLYRHFDAAPVYFPTMHGNGLPVGLLLLALSVRILFGEGCRTPVLLFLLVGSLTFLSDEIVLIQFGVPLVGGALLFACAKVVRWPRAALLTGLVVAAALLGRLFYALLGRWPELLLKRPYVGLSLRGARIIADALLRQSPVMLREGVPALLAAGLWIGGLALWAWRARRPGQPALVPRQAWCHGVLLLVGPCALLATLGGLLVTKHAEVPQRYLLPVFFVPFIGLALVEAGRAASVRLHRVAQTILVVMAALGLWMSARTSGSLATPYPVWVREIDQIAMRHRLVRGFASYDRAKPLAVLSRAGLHVSALRGEFPYVWIDNSYGFLACDGPAPRLVPYDFIVSDGLSPSRLRVVYGRPAAVERTGSGLEVWIYDAAAGRPMNMGQFLGSLQVAANDFGYHLDFTLGPAFLRLEGEDLLGRAAGAEVVGDSSGDGVGRLRPGTACISPWQRVGAGRQVATARIAWTGEGDVVFGLGYAADNLMVTNRAAGRGAGTLTNLSVRLETAGLTDLRLVVRNDGQGPVFVDRVELRTAK